MATADLGAAARPDGVAPIRQRRPSCAQPEVEAEILMAKGRGPEAYRTACAAYHQRAGCARRADGLDGGVRQITGALADPAGPRRAGTAALQARRSAPSGWSEPLGIMLSLSAPCIATMLAAAAPAAAGRPRARRGRQPRQVDLPGHHEPRDPHAAERRAGHGPGHGRRRACSDRPARAAGA